MQNHVKVPVFLHDVHGEKTNWQDILLVHFLAAITTLCAVLLTIDLDWKIWKYILLGLVAYDLGGGVIANLTYSTGHYYDGSKKKGLNFYASIFSSQLFYQFFSLAVYR